MKQSKKSLGMKISAFVLSFAMVCTLLAGVNVVAFAADDSDESLTDTVSVLRAYNPNNGEHLMTVDEAEYNANVARGYSAEGEAWVAPLHSNTEVWRAYNPNSGEHMLAPEAEVKALEAAGWQNEGLKMYSCEDEENVPIYRVFNPNATDAGSHHYCGEEEAAALVALGWQWDNNGEPVIYGCLEEPPVILVGLTDADQLSANTLTVTFDQNATGLVDADDISIDAADGTVNIPISSMTLSDDGMSAVIELAFAFQNEKEYVVSLNASEVNLTASVGDVETITVLTASAEQYKETPIKFVMLDENGIDVTSTVSMNQVDITVDGADESVTSPIAKASLTMSTVGETATVTVSYNPGTTYGEEVVGIGEVICVPGEAEVGTPLYYDLDENNTDTASLFVNATNNCSKFYWGLFQSTPVVVEEGKDNPGVYFCAGDLASMSVYDYDEYEVESSNENILSVQSVDNGEKYVNMTVSGNKAGTANIVITATKNELESVYVVPVTVVPEGELSSNITISVDRATISNAFDTDYYGTAKLVAKDSNGKEIPTADYSVSWELADNDKNVVCADLPAGSAIRNAVMAAGNGELSLNGQNPFEENWNTTTQAFTAFGTSAQTTKLTATVTYNGEEKTKSVTVKVKEIDKDCWNIAGSAGVDLTYKTELSKNKVNQFNEPYAVARLAAYKGSTFVGYVRATSNTGGTAGATTVGTVGYNEAPIGQAAGAATNSAINVKATSLLKNLKFGVKKGSKYATTDATNGAAVPPAMGGTVNRMLGASHIFGLYGDSMSDAQLTAIPEGEGSIAILSINLANVLAGQHLMFAVNTDPSVALDGNTATLYADNSVNGAYKVQYAYVKGNDTKETESEASLTVSNQILDSGMYPAVTVKDLNVESLDEDTIIKDGLKTLTDMNNDENDPSAIQGLYDYSKADGYTPYAGTDKTKALIKYAKTCESYGLFKGVLPINIDFYVPVNATFYEMQ